MSSSRAIKRFWNNYKFFIKRLMKDGSLSHEQSLTYWQNRLFTEAIIFALPLSILVLIPCIFLELCAGHHYTASLDVLMVVLIMFIALNQKLTLDTRKILIVIIVGICAVIMITFTEAVIMGFIYMFALIIFVSLQFSDKIAYLTVGVSFIVFTIISMLLFFTPHTLNTLSKTVDLNRWLLYSTNFIFVNLIMVRLIRQLLNGLEETMLRVVFLNQELHKEVAEKNHRDAKLKESEIQHTKAIQVRNEQFQQIAYLQSHTIRRPLANIKGILELVMQKDNVETEKELLEYLDVSVKQLDTVINDIVKHSKGADTPLPNLPPSQTADQN